MTQTPPPGESVPMRVAIDIVVAAVMLLPLVLLGLGLPLCVLPFSWVRRRLRRPRP